jgi:hypothetical protein
MKKLIMVTAAILSMSIPAVAHASESPNGADANSSSVKTPARFTMTDWARLKKKDRMVIIIGAIESLLLATQSKDGGKTPVNPVCLTNDSPLGIEAKLMDVSKRYPNDAFVDVFLVVTNCLEGAA